MKQEMCVVGCKMCLHYSFKVKEKMLFFSELLNKLLFFITLKYSSIYLNLQYQMWEDSGFRKTHCFWKMCYF